MKKINYDKLLKSVTCGGYPEPVCFGKYTVATDVVRIVVVKRPGICDFDKTKSWPNGFPTMETVENVIVDPSLDHSIEVEAESLLALISPVFSDRKRKVVPAFFYEDGAGLCIQYDPTYIRGNDCKDFVKTSCFPYTGKLLRDSFHVTTGEGVKLSTCGVGFNLKFLYQTLRFFSGKVVISFSSRGGFRPFSVACQDAEVFIMPIRL